MKISIILGNVVTQSILKTKIALNYNLSMLFHQIIILNTTHLKQTGKNITNINKNKKLSKEYVLGSKMHL